MALSPSVAARHSASPVRNDRSPAGVEPVPGLLNDRNVVVPPNAAATESWKNRSGVSSVRDARVRVDVDRAREDQHPGRVDHPVGAGGRAGQVRLDGPMMPPSTATSASRGPVGRDDGAAADDEVGHGRPRHLDASVAARDRPADGISVRSSSRMGPDFGRRRRLSLRPR